MNIQVQGEHYFLAALIRKGYRHAVYALLLLLVSLSASARSEVSFRSGQKYHIGCLWSPGGALVPGDMPFVQNASPLVYYSGSHANDDRALWIITEHDGYFTLCHASTGRYLTYDGERTVHKRYVCLTNKRKGDASLWMIYAGKQGLLIRNKSNLNHYLNVRLGSCIAGTYASSATEATGNERFYLTTSKGQTVTDFCGTAVTLPPLNATTSTAKAGKAQQQPAPVATPAPATHLTFRINGIRPVYDRLSQRYLCPLPSRLSKSKSFTAKVQVDGFDGTLRYTVDGALAGSGHQCKFPLNGNRGVQFEVSRKSVPLASVRVVFTFVPVVEIADDAFYSSRFTTGSLRLLDPDGRTPDTLLGVKFRLRGDYSLHFSKKSYAVKLVGSTGKSLNRPLLGLRDDNYWILDGAAVDPSRLRNRVAMDLWNDSAVKPHYARHSSKVRSGTRGRMVEVVVNGQYAGIYCLSERTDRKQLDLDHDSGRLYKSRQWDEWTLFGARRPTGKPLGTKPPGYNPNAETWCAWEAKYPAKPDWEPLYWALDFVSCTSNSDFSSQVDDFFDLPALCDYWLFIELLLATDNSGKNMLWAIGNVKSNQRLTPAPWDLDGTFGRAWNGHRAGCEPTIDYRDYLASNNQLNVLFERLQSTNARKWKNMLADRWRELRKGAFRPAAIAGRFSRYYDLLRAAGALQREQTRWNSAERTLNFDYEESYLSAWIESRVATLDAKYGR